MSEFINIFVKTFLIVAIVVTFFLLIRLALSLKKERRVAKFAIDAISDRPEYFFDKINNSYIKFTKRFSKSLKRSVFFKNYSKRYDKYVFVNKDNLEGIDFVASKFIVSFIVVAITIISDVLRGKSISIMQLLVSFLIGFFILDLFLLLDDKRKYKKIENDVLKAVIIMNNAFKSGRSIMQAVDLVSTELTGTVADEFRKISLDLTYGLDLEVVFKRFADRVNLDEVKYMASSLIIINKTGGNVVQVFSSIEKNFLNRKKLKDELESTTALSKLVYKILIVMPILIFVLIYILNPTYFTPYITTNVGRMLLVIILILYLIYIIVVKKITKAKDW